MSGFQYFIFLTALMIGAFGCSLFQEKKVTTYSHKLGKFVKVTREEASEIADEYIKRRNEKWEEHERREKIYKKFDTTLKEIVFKDYDQIVKEYHKRIDEIGSYDSFELGNLKYKPKTESPIKPKEIDITLYDCLENRTHPNELRINLKEDIKAYVNGADHPVSRLSQWRIKGFSLVGKRFSILAEAPEKYSYDLDDLKKIEVEKIYHLQPIKFQKDKLWQTIYGS